MRSRGALRAAAGCLLTLAVACLPVGAGTMFVGAAPSPPAAPTGIHRIQHVVIMMENRSFDEYFGTYPGADGLPRNRQGEFTVCMPDPRRARARGRRKPRPPPECPGKRESPRRPGE